ncbi:MAG: VTT domain-containing protein [Hyphomonadaceae bacterium]|nr:VTT domain-containing protein [Hyphomonadaceae bacterium]
MRLYKDEVRLAAIHKSFETNGLLVLFVCQALPILPEVSCCLAGTTRMPFPKFAFGFAVGTVPFAVIAAYAGSISTLSDPTPAIIASIGIAATLWVLWSLLKRRGEAG